MVRVSTKFRQAVKNQRNPAYVTASKANISPSTLSSLMRAVAIDDGVWRVIEVGKVLGLAPHECFEPVELGQVSTGEEAANA
jgi:hypothetical protein